MTSVEAAPEGGQAPRWTILHLSDTQFGDHHRFETGTGVGSLSGRVIDTVREWARQTGSRPDVLVVSGDVAEKARLSEYEEAERFIEALRGEFSLTADRVVLVPGNHDVNWKLLEIAIGQAQEEEEWEPPVGEDPAVARAAYARARLPWADKWRHYGDFVDRVCGEGSWNPASPYRVHDFGSELGLIVAGLNSTMQETLDDHWGYCGEEQYRAAVAWVEEAVSSTPGARGEPSVNVVAVVHHNPRETNVDDQSKLRDLDDLGRCLEDTIDLLLHGHTHAGRAESLPKGTPVLGAGSAAVEPDQRPQEVPNQFQVIQGRADGSIVRWAWAWAPDQKQWIPDGRVRTEQGAGGFGPVRDARPEAKVLPPAEGGEDEFGSPSDPIRKGDHSSSSPRHQSLVARLGGEADARAGSGVRRAVAIPSAVAFVDDGAAGARAWLPVRVRAADRVVLSSDAVACAAASGTRVRIGLLDGAAKVDVWWDSVEVPGLEAVLAVHAHRRHADLLAVVSGTTRVVSLYPDGDHHGHTVDTGAAVSGIWVPGGFCWVSANGVLGATPDVAVQRLPNTGLASVDAAIGRYRWMAIALGGSHMTIERGPLGGDSHARGTTLEVEATGAHVVRALGADPDTVRVETTSGWHDVTWRSLASP